MYNNKNMIFLRNQLRGDKNINPDLPAPSLRYEKRSFLFFDIKIAHKRNKNTDR